MFLFNLTYIKPILEVEKMLPAHISYLEENYNAKKFICSGRKNPRTGRIILCNCATKQEASYHLNPWKDLKHLWKNQIVD